MLPSENRDPERAMRPLIVVLFAAMVIDVAIGLWLVLLKVFG